MLIDISKEKIKFRLKTIKDDSFESNMKPGGRGYNFHFGVTVPQHPLVKSHHVKI